MPAYQPREKNVIKKILQDHFSAFEENYDTQYSEKYGKYRIIRIKETVERFIECGDYSKGIARIKSTNPHCGHEIFDLSVAKAGTSAQVVTRNDSCFFQNTSQQMCS